MKNLIISDYTANILKVVLFAVAFAFVEAAVVVYLRQLLGASEPFAKKNEVLLLLPGIAFLEPQTALRIINDSALLNIELIREAATIVMLFSVSLLAANNIKKLIAFFFLAFGIWDLFYYVFLKLTIDWPKTPGDLDTFFLLPVPWIGPVFVPIILSSLFIVGSLMYLVKSGYKKTNSQLTK
ncbi:MAG: hypothetical protein HYT11_00605 [Candidatus Levybacteria bacterium]|nr:hypothetical protein [Candidatus Levybacteria bacterium]